MCAYLRMAYVMTLSVTQGLILGLFRPF